MIFPDITLAQKIASSMNIPPQPGVLITVSQEANSANPRNDIIVEAIKSDVGLSSGLLQVVNSPLFGLTNKISSVDHGVSLLGIDRVQKLVTTVSMRNAVSGNLDLGRFWDSAAEIGTISCDLARRLSGIDPDDAYSLGLFHDCGLPIMMQKFKDYKVTLKDINVQKISPATLLEDEYYECNHAIIGFCLCEKWFMPPQLAKAVLLHHDSFSSFRPDNSEDEATMVLLSILKMSEHISDIYRQEFRETVSSEWEENSGDVLKFMNLSSDDFEDLKISVVHSLEASALSG